MAGCGYAFRHDPDDFAGLYGAFDGLLPDNQKLYLSRNGHELGFYIMDDVMEYLTYHIPVQIMDGARGKLRDLYLSFFSLLQQKQEFVPFCDNPLLPYFTAESQYGHVDKKWASLLKRYSGGTIKRKMEMFSMEPEYDIDSLKGKIDSYRASGRKTKNILALMRKGLDIIGEDLFFNYSAYSIEDDDYYDTYCPVEVSRLIHLIYDHRDIITENILECVCNEVNEQGYEFLSSELLRVEPFMTRPFNENKPLYNYINWLNNFNNELRNI